MEEIPSKWTCVGCRELAYPPHMFNCGHFVCLGCSKKIKKCTFRCKSPKEEMEKQFPQLIKQKQKDKSVAPTIRTPSCPIGIGPSTIIGIVGLCFAILVILFVVERWNKHRTMDPIRIQMKDGYVFDIYIKYALEFITNSTIKEIERNLTDLVHKWAAETDTIHAAIQAIHSYQNKFGNYIRNSEVYKHILSVSYELTENYNRPYSCELPRFWKKDTEFKVQNLKFSSGTLFEEVIFRVNFVTKYQQCESTNYRYKNNVLSINVKLKLDHVIRDHCSTVDVYEFVDKDEHISSLNSKIKSELDPHNNFIFGWLDPTVSYHGINRFE